MSFKQFMLPEIGTLVVYKRRGVGNLRLSLRHDGSVRVTIPTWLPYQSAIDFARSRQAWIKEHSPTAASSLEEGQPIGKAHRLQFLVSPAACKTSTRIKGSAIMITYPSTSSRTASDVQKAARQASIRALRTEAEQLLPIKLKELAHKHDFSYRSVKVRQLTSRWGSCDQNQNIVLSIYLMLLPWTLIEYVLLHELTHTKIMKHGPEFWSAMKRLDPKTPEHRKAMKAYRPNF